MKIDFVRWELCVRVVLLLGELGASDWWKRLFWLGSRSLYGLHCGLFGSGKLEALVHLMALTAAEVAGVIVGL